MNSAQSRREKALRVSAEPSFVVNGLRVVYGKALAVNDVSLKLIPGAITALVGPNGAGKSSALLAMYGSVATARGTIQLDGRSIERDSVRARARAGVALVPQGRQLFPRLTVRENLAVMAEMLGAPRSRVDEELDRFPILATRSASLAGVLSGGEQQMLAVARALLAEPRVLLLDELVTGLAPAVVNRLLDTMAELSGSGATILLAMPSLGSTADVIDRGYVLVRGQIVDVAEDGGTALDRAYRAALGVE